MQTNTEVKPQEPKAEVKAVPVAVTVPSRPCVTQVKEYEECLQSLSYYWTSCKTQQDKLKACPEFNKYLEKQHRKQK